MRFVAKHYLGMADEATVNLNGAVTDGNSIKDKAELMRRAESLIGKLGFVPAPVRDRK